MAALQICDPLVSNSNNGFKLPEATLLAFVAVTKKAD
jgi:hypothetical protein